MFFFILLFGLIVNLFNNFVVFFSYDKLLIVIEEVVSLLKGKLVFLIIIWLINFCRIFMIFILLILFILREIFCNLFCKRVFFRVRMIE